MAVLPPTKGSRRRPSFRGNLLQDTTRGVERSRAWPGPRGVLQTPNQKAQNDWFRQVNWAFKFMAPALQDAFTRATQRTALYPRDLLSIIAANGLVRRVSEDGKVQVPMPYMQAVSESLDTISQVPGTTLVRGPNFWTAQPANAPGGVLVSRLQRTSAYAVGASIAPIPWQVATFDEIGMWDPLQPTLLTVPPNVGRLELIAAYQASGGSVTNCAIYIEHNGVRIATTHMAQGFAASAPQCSTGPIAVAPGDEFRVVHNIANISGKNILVLGSFFSARFG